MEENTQVSVEKKKMKLWKKLIIIFSSLLILVVLGIYIGGIWYFQDKFFFNTSINKTDVSKQTVNVIEELTAKKAKGYQIQVVCRSGSKEVLTAEQTGYHYVSKGEAQKFKSAQNPYFWVESLWKKYNYTFSYSTDFDEEALTESAKGLDCLNEKKQVKPENAYINMEANRFEIVEEIEGTKVDVPYFLEKLKSYVKESKNTFSLEEEDCYIKPEVRKDNERLNQVTNDLNKYCDARIEYAFGEKKEVLDGSVIRTWMSYDANGVVKMDEEQARNFVYKLAEKYDTYNKAREFKTSDGTYVTVKGGSYGWKMDQEAETEELVAILKVGAVQERTAIFAKTADSFDNSDLGNTYIEVDLTKQHIFMYKDGEVIVSSDFVSGDMRREGRATPSGTFRLYYKTSPAVLKSDKPGDSYRTPVTYWMPFNGGVGLHDADWRYSFGGNIYVSNGSHGCINLPVDSAKQIYQNIYEGYPIICFYR